MRQRLRSENRARFAWIVLLRLAVFLPVVAHDCRAQSEYPLQDAAKKGDLGDVKRLLDQGADVNAKTWTLQAETRGWTALHQAALYGHRDVVALLLERGAKANGKTGRGWTPLHGAVLHGRTDLVTLLIDRGASLSELATELWLRYIQGFGAAAAIEDHRPGGTPLHGAALHGHRDVVALLIDRGADVNAKTREKGWTPLHMAAWRGHRDVVALLLDRGADVNRKDSDAATPLYWAAMGGNSDVAMLLLDRSADVHARTEQGSTWIRAVDPGDNTHMSVSVGTANIGWTPLHVAAWQGSRLVVELLLDKGAGASARARDAWTPLHVAAWRGRLDVAELLLKRGAEVNAATGAIMTAGSKQYARGSTPLDVALWAGNKEVAELLRQNGGDEKL